MFAYGDDGDDDGDDGDDDGDDGDDDGDNVGVSRDT